VSFKGNPVVDPEIIQDQVRDGMTLKPKTTNGRHPELVSGSVSCILYLQSFPYM